jgi:hypothetical protein
MAAISCLITKPVAKRNQVPEGRLKSFRLALASKPHNQFFLCHVPSQNLDNTYNSDALAACERAKTEWVQVTSKAKEGAGAEGYRITPAIDRDAFLEPKWPTESLQELIEITFPADPAHHQRRSPGIVAHPRPPAGTVVNFKNVVVGDFEYEGTRRLAHSAVHGRLCAGRIVAARTHHPGLAG